MHLIGLHSCYWVLFSVLSVCLSFCPRRGGEVHGTITHDILDITIPGSLLEMFKLVQLGPHCAGTNNLPPQTCSNWFIMKLKQAVGILLECFLVVHIIVNNKSVSGIKYMYRKKTVKGLIIFDLIACVIKQIRENRCGGSMSNQCHAQTFHRCHIQASYVSC